MSTYTVTIELEIERTDDNLSELTLKEATELATDGAEQLRTDRLDIRDATVTTIERV